MELEGALLARASALELAAIEAEAMGNTFDSEALDLRSTIDEIWPLQVWDGMGVVNTHTHITHTQIHMHPHPPTHTPTHTFSLWT